jgi:hypothetical protein
MSTAAGPGTNVSGSSGGGVQSTGGGASSGAGAFSWNDGWRSQIAGTLSTGGVDAAELKRLERFTDPSLIYKSYRELENKIASGEFKPQLRKDATADETARWRAESGIPLKAEDYKVNMPAGRQPPKEDDAFLKSFLTSAHASNYTQAQVDGAIGAFYAEVDRQAETLTAAEKVAEGKCEDALRLAWGADYRTNKAMEEALLARAPAGFRDRFLNGYLADHTKINASPEAHQWLVQMEREINPAATVLPGVHQGAGANLEAELAGLKKMMKDPNSEYWKGPKAEANQARYRDLIEADEKLRAKAGAKQAA